MTHSLTLTVIDGPGQGETWSLNDLVSTLGREDHNTVALADGKVSRVHAHIKRNAQGFLLEDLASRNGTRVNGEPIQSWLLRDGDKIGLGRVLLQVRLEQEAPEDWAAAESDTIILSSSSEAWIWEREGHQDMVAMHRSLEMLFRFLRDGAGLTSLEQLASHLADTLDHKIGADRVVLIVCDPQTQARKAYFRQRHALDQSHARLPISHSIVNYAADHRVAILSQDAQADLRFVGSESINSHEIGTALCAPVLINHQQQGEEIVGFVYCDRLGGGAAFEKAELEMVMLFAGSIGHLVPPLRLSALKPSQDQNDQQESLLGESQTMSDLRALITRIAPTEATVLIQGPSGCGKERVAQALHRQSRRHQGPFEALNCGAIPPELVESVLFGHVKGAFTGATEDHKGIFETADQGSLFLDEVAELSLEHQSHLLRVLETGVIRRVGDHSDLPVDVRVLCATHRDLQAMVSAGSFREDLFFRINVLPLSVPALIERPGDVKLLAQHFLKHFAGQCHKRLSFDTEVLAQLEKYPWPGNVRELKNCIERLVVLAESASITSDILPPEIQKHQAGEDDLSLAALEKKHIVRVLNLTGGNKKEAAALLDIDRSTLYAKIRKYQCDQEPDG